MAEKKTLSGIIIGMMLVVGIAFLFPVSEQAIPPTPAWNRIEVSSNATYIISSQNFTEAVSYADNRFIISDGSLNISMGIIP